VCLRIEAGQLSLLQGCGHLRVPGRNDQHDGADQTYPLTTQV
jgi:hypothetical protein